MSRQKIALNVEEYQFEPFPHLIGLYFVPYGMTTNSPMRNYILQEDFDKIMFPFTYKIEYQFNFLNRRQFRYHYMVILDKNNRIQKIVKFA